MGYDLFIEGNLNRINEVFQQTLRCNMHSGLVMDCPHREKLPYTGDGKLVMKSAYYSNDVIGYYYKWFRDILDAREYLTSLGLTLTEEI